MTATATATSPADLAGAVCAQVDPELFFPEKGGSTKAAKRLCNGDPDRGAPPCPVRLECLQIALDEDHRFGVWGGLSERERAALAGRRQSRECADGCGTIIPAERKDRFCRDCAARRRAASRAGYEEKRRHGSKPAVARCGGCGNRVRDDMPCPHCLVRAAARRKGAA